MRLRRLREAGEFVMRSEVSGVRSVAEREVLLDAVNIGFVDQVRTAQAAAAFRAFGLAEVAPAGAMAEDLAAGGDFEPFAHRLFGFDAFGTSHKINLLSKRARNIGKAPWLCKRHFPGFPDSTGFNDPTLQRSNASTINASTIN